MQQLLSVENYLTHHYPPIQTLPQTAKKLLFSGVKKIFHENQINEFLLENTHKDTFSFIESVLEYFEVTIGLKKEEMARIPAYGRCRNNFV